MQNPVFPTNCLAGTIKPNLTAAVTTQKHKQLQENDYHIYT